MSTKRKHCGGNLEDMPARTLHSRTLHSCNSDMSSQTDSVPFLKDMSAQTLDFKRQPFKEMSGIFSANLEKISRTGEEDTTLWRLAFVSSQMSSEAVGDKRKVNAGHWSTQLEGMVGYGDAPVVGEMRRAHELAEMRRNNLRIDGEARILQGEERKMRAIMQRIDDA